VIEIGITTGVERRSAGTKQKGKGMRGTKAVSRALALLKVAERNARGSRACLRT
jgi:hypothetical protein